MSKPDNKSMLTPDQLCDALEIHLGEEQGRRKCRELLSAMKQDPNWVAQLNTLACTVKVFRRVEVRDVPQDVSYRLMRVLDLDSGTCDGETGE